MCIYKVVKNNKMKKILSESTLLRLLENCVEKVMEGLAPQGYDGHIFSAQELKSMYENQNGLDEVQQKALNAAMWVRARIANYHGYSEDWPNIMYKGGKYFYWNGGQLLEVPYRG